MKILHSNMFLCLDKAIQPSVCQRLRVKSCHLKLEVCEKHSTNGVWLFSLTDLGQCFKKEKTKRKVGF